MNSRVDKRVCTPFAPISCAPDTFCPLKQHQAKSTQIHVTPAHLLVALAPQLTAASKQQARRHCRLMA